MKITRGRFIAGLAALLAGAWPKRSAVAVCLDDPEAKAAWKRAAETALVPQASMRNALRSRLYGPRVEFDSENFGTVTLRRYEELGA